MDFGDSYVGYLHQILLRECNFGSYQTNIIPNSHCHFWFI